MARKINVNQELQELIQQIQTNYQEGIDYEFFFPASKKVEIGGYPGHIKIISPHLKKYCQERFDFPWRINDYLDYGKRQGLSWFTYRIGKDREEDQLFWVVQENKMNFSEENPKNCAVCGKLVPLKDGRMKLWDSECRIIGQDEDGYSLKFSRPLAVAYFHPTCSKKYSFANQQVNPSVSKEKILRNLEKICLDPLGELANAELLKENGVLKNYDLLNVADYEKWLKKVSSVVIEGEKIDLQATFPIGSYDHQDIKKALLLEIKQNPTQWTIAELGITRGREEWPIDRTIIKHKSGRKHWKVGFYHFWSNRRQMRKEWDKVETTLKGYKSAVNNEKSNDIERENLKSIFQKYNIKKITFEKGELFIEYYDKINSLARATTRPEFHALKNYCQEHNEKEISWEKLNNNSTNNTKSWQWENKYLWLVGGIMLGVIFSALIVFCQRRKKRKIN